MATSIVDADSLLVVDVGTVTTRAILFDVVDGIYRYLATGLAPTTVGAPFHNASEGLHRAIDQLQTITGRILIGADQQLITPSAEDGSGVDTIAATMSAGAPLKIVAVGLLEDVSLDSARRLAMSTYGRVMHTISLNDRRRQDTRIDAIIHLRPNLIIIAGGTDNGASQSVLKMLEPVGLACYLMPQYQRPAVLFAGNQAIKEAVKSTLGEIVPLYFTPNIRPTLEIEQLQAAQAHLGKVYGRLRSRQIPGVSDLNNMAGGGLLPTASAFGRVISFLSKAHGVKKGVLGVDVGASSTTIAAAYSGKLTLGVYPQFGLGNSLANLINNVSLTDITQWLSENVSDGYVREYLRNKALYPATIPTTVEDLAVEQAIARQLMQSSLKMTLNNFPEQAIAPAEDLLPWVEPIIATGSVLTQAPSIHHAALMLLDGLQPTGTTTLVLDQNRVAAALGAAAAINSVLAVQILDSNSFLHIGTVISPVGKARPGTPVLQVKITYADGQSSSLEIKQGSLEVIPLSYGQSARLQIQPYHRYDIGMGAPGRGGSLRVTGGALGVIIDARGRPLQLPSDPGKRIAMHKQWLLALGGS